MRESIGYSFAQLANTQSMEGLKYLDDSSKSLLVMARLNEITFHDSLLAAKEDLFHLLTANTSSLSSSDASLHSAAVEQAFSKATDLQQGQEELRRTLELARSFRNAAMEKYASAEAEAAGPRV